MRPLFPRLSLRARLGFSCALLLAAGLSGGCDRHSAAEVPESYGHGSNRAREVDFKSHQTDSRTGSHSFSDTQGAPEASEHEPQGEHKVPGESPSPDKPDRFFPKGS